VRVIWNTDKEEHRKQLVALFNGARHFECAIAFAKESGFKQIEKPFRTSLIGGMSGRIILGLDFCLTDPSVLDTLLKWSQTFQQLEVYVSHSEPSVCFHPKVYAFSYGARAAMLVGSANLTSGGFGNNWECSVLLHQPTFKEISQHLQALIDGHEVKKLTAPILAEYREKHRITHALRAVNERQIARLSKAGTSSLELLEAIVRELTLDHSPAGLEGMIRERTRSIAQARTAMRSLTTQHPQTVAVLLPLIRALRECFHSGGLQRHISMIVEKPTEFLHLVQLAHKANTEQSSPRQAYERLRPVAEKIRGLGPNWISEILHALDPAKYAILNQNSVAGMALAGIEFPIRPSKANISGEVYASFCEHGSKIAKRLGLSDLSQLDAVFNYAYFNYQGDD